MAVDIAKQTAPIITEQVSKGTGAKASSKAESAETAGTGTQAKPAPDTAPSTSDPDEAKRKTLEGLTLKDLRKHPAFQRASEEDVNAAVQRALQKRDQEARRRELESLPPEERYVQIGREAEAEQTQRQFLQGM